MIGAEWCGGCRLLKPEAQKLCQENNLRFEHLDFDKEEHKKLNLDLSSLKSLPVFVFKSKISDEIRTPSELKSFLVND